MSINLLQIISGFLFNQVGERVVQRIRKPQHEKNNYGLQLYPERLYDTALRICNTLDDDPNYAENVAKFLVEIAAVETKSGKYWDKTKFAGMGITQIDKIGFVDCINRTPKDRKVLVLDKFGVDMDRLNWEELRHNIPLCFLMTRLIVKLWPEMIPNTHEERALLWKKRYNTVAGKGTPEHYIASLNYVDSNFV